MKKRMKAILSVLFMAAMLVNIIPVYAGATEATTAPTAAAEDAAVTEAPAEDAAAGGAVTYSGSYNAYMGIQTDTQLWIFRNACDDATYGVGTEEFKGLSAVASGTSTRYDGTFTDAVVDGDGTYTVTLEGPDFQSETHLSLFFISTDIPLSDQIKVTDVQCKFDGSTKYTFDEAYLDPESKEYVKILCLNNWNNDVKDLFFYPMPFNKAEITFTISGMGYESAAAAAAEPTPTVAPADTSTDTPADDTTAPADTTQTDTATEEEDGGLSTPVIIGIVAAAVVVIAIVVVVLTRKKKN
jgi:hypothetical protein